MMKRTHWAKTILKKKEEKKKRRGGVRREEAAEGTDGAGRRGSSVDSVPAPVHCTLQEAAERVWGRATRLQTGPQREGRPRSPLHWAARTPCRRSPEADGASRPPGGAVTTPLCVAMVMMSTSLFFKKEGHRKISLLQVVRSSGSSV